MPCYLEALQVACGLVLAIECVCAYAVRRAAYRSDLTAVSCSFGLRTAKQDAPSC